MFIVLVIRSLTVLACALANLARDRTNPWGNRCTAKQLQCNASLSDTHSQMPVTRLLLPPGSHADMLLGQNPRPHRCVPAYILEDGLGQTLCMPHLGGSC